MPDRYGEPPPHDDEPHDEPDPTPNTDYAAAAKRGIALIQATMGWKTPKH